MKPHIKYGMMLGLICAVLYISDTYVGSAVAHDVFTYGSYLGIAGMIYMAAKERRAMQHDNLSFGEGFNTGALVTLIGGGLAAAAFYINLKFFNRQFVIDAKERAQEVFESRYDSDEQTEMALKMVGPGMLSVTHFIIILIVGILATLLIAAILKRDDRNPMVDDDTPRTGA